MQKAQDLHSLLTGAAAMAVGGTIEELEAELESYAEQKKVHPNDYAQVHLRLGCAYARQARFGARGAGDDDGGGGGGGDGDDVGTAVRVARARKAATTAQGTAATHLHKSIEHFERHAPTLAGESFV